MKRRFPVGIWVFGIILILDSLSQLYLKLLKPGYYSWYSRIFQPLPEQAIFLRYLISILFRMLGLTACIGILLRKEILRKFTLLMCCLTIISAYWKHPFYALDKHSRAIIETISQSTGHHALTSLAYIRVIEISSLACLYALDIGLPALMLYYFTRPYVKERFR